MTTDAVSNRKAELLEGALRYLLEHGVASLSLRPLAAALGTSARMLVFHFGSKEQLVQEVMQALNARLQRSLQAMRGPGTQPQEVPPLKRFWEWVIAKENQPCLRLLCEVQVVASKNPQVYGAYLTQASRDWQRAALAAMSAENRTPEMATLCIALVDGLFLELMAGADPRRLSRALDLFIATIRAAHTGPAEPPGRSASRSRPGR